MCVCLENVRSLSDYSLQAEKTTGRHDELRLCVDSGRQHKEAL